MFAAVLLLTELIVETNGLTINCKYFMEPERWPGFYNLYSCDGTAVLTGNLQTIEAVTGTHLAGKNDSSVKNFVFHDQLEVKTIPLDLYKFFPNLEAVFFFRNPIKYVGKEHLYGLSKLKSADFIDNQITAIGNDLFEYQPNQIEAISFSYNPLKNVGLNVFSEMSKLRSFHTLPGHYENCYVGFVENDVNGAARMITDIKLKCFPTEEMILDHKFKNLQKSFENLLSKLENSTDVCAMNKSRLSELEVDFDFAIAHFNNFKSKTESHLTSLSLQVSAIENKIAIGNEDSVKRDAELSKSLNQVKINLNSKLTSLTKETGDRFEQLNTDLTKVKTRQDTFEGRIEKISTECCATIPFFKR